MDLLTEWINEALQGHRQHVGVQMGHTMRLGHMYGGDLGGSADQAQNPSGWCVKSPSLHSLFQGSAAYQTHLRALFLHSQLLHYLCFGESWIFLDCTKMLLFPAPRLFPFLSGEQRGLLVWPRGEALLGRLPWAHPWSALYKTHTMTIPLNTCLIFMTYSKQEHASTSSICLRVFSQGLTYPECPLYKKKYNPSAILKHAWGWWRWFYWGWETKHGF